MQYPWVMSSVPVLSTHELYPQYPWGHAVPVRICIIRESYYQYLWGYAIPVSHILGTREGPGDSRSWEPPKEVDVIVWKLFIRIWVISYFLSSRSVAGKLIEIKKPPETERHKTSTKVCTVSFERPVNYLCDAWHVFPPKYEAWTHFNRPWTEYQCQGVIWTLLIIFTESVPGSHLNIADHIHWICQSINMSVILLHGTCTVNFSSLDRSPVRYQWSGIIKLLQFTIVRFF